MIYIYILCKVLSWVAGKSGALVDVTVCKVATVKLAGACLALAEVPGLTFRISHVNMHGARFTFLVPH